MPTLPALDKQIAASPRGALRHGDLRASPGWGQPLHLGDGYACTPGRVPGEVEKMPQIAALTRALEADPQPPDVPAPALRLSELRLHLALRLEKLSGQRTL
ncbi:MAG: DUF1992 domain-containing protein [Burkholderiaceae bacterium]